jgi:serine/threonine protein kinase
VDGASEQTAVAGYQAVHLVAHSYLGSLWLALDQRNGSPGKPVLLRRVQLSEQTRSEAFQRMACAGRDAMALSHENVLPVVDVVLQPDSLALVYEYVEAEPLRALQSWATHRRLAFPVGVSLRLGLDLLRGVRALHGTLLGWPSAPPFGGLSPDSILVSRDGRTRLCDPLVSSCATMLEGMNLNVAKLAYTAPEQAYATAPLAAASDIFTCGVLLWELLAGNRLFTGPRATVERKLLEHDLPNLREQLPSGVEVSERLIALVERCLASNAGRRPQSPAELISELEQCGHPVASLEQVGAFVAELAGARFEQRKMTVRSLPSLRAPAGKASGTLAASSSTSSAQRRVPLPGEGASASVSLRSAVSSPGLAAILAPAPGRVSLPRVPLPERQALARLALSKAPPQAEVASTPRLAAPGAPEPSAPAPVDAAPAPTRPEAAPAPTRPEAAPTRPEAAPVARRVDPAPVAPRAEAAPVARRPDPAPVAPRAEPAPVARRPDPAPVAPRAEAAPVARAAEAPPPLPPPADATPVPPRADPALVPPRAALAPPRANAPPPLPPPADPTPVPPPADAAVLERPAPAPRVTARAHPDSVVVVPPSEPLLGLPPEMLVIGPQAEAGASRRSSVPPLLVPAGTTTMIGLALPPSLLQASAQFEQRLRKTSSAPAGTLVMPSDAQALRPSTPPSSQPALPIPSLIPTLRPRPPGSEAPPSTPPPSSGAAASRRTSGWSQPPGAASARPRKRTVVASLLATLTLAGAVATALLLRPSPNLWSATAFWSGSHHSSEPQRAAATPPREPAPVPQSPVVDAGASADGGLPSASAVPPPASAELAAAPAWHTAKLGDDQLRLLFGLERRVQLPDCRERLGASLRLHKGASPKKSQAQLKAARRQLVRGNTTEAQRLLCSATAHFANNVAAWQALAELTLQLGDAARAKLAIEQALERRPKDSTLLGLLGDAEAVLGDLAQSRALWAKSLRVSADDAESTRRLAQKFASVGARKLHDWNYGSALAQYRRAVVLSLGDAAPSAGMGEALRRLGQPQAALAWAERATARKQR